MALLEKSVADLKARLMTMAVLAKSAVNRSVKALIERDDDLARKVQEDDNALDEFEIEVDERAVLLLSRAPLAADLRLIMVAMKASQDLERVGDESTTISRRAIQLNKEPQLREFVDIPRMARLVVEMLDDALDAFVNANPEKALKIIPRDKEVDRLNKTMQKELAEIMKQRSDAVDRCLHLMAVSRSLERIGDHAKNVAEEVVYLFEGRDVRHEVNLSAAAAREAEDAAERRRMEMRRKA